MGRETWGQVRILFQRLLRLPLLHREKNVELKLSSVFPTWNEKREEFFNQEHIIYIKENNIESKTLDVLLKI